MSYEDLLAQVQQLAEQNRAQAQVIDILVDAAERSSRDVSARLSTQHVVEQRTARLHHSEGVLRSVIEALDGALCILGRDGTVLDCNQRWPAAVGSDFFDWCRTTPDLHHLLTDVAATVTELLASDPMQWAEQSTSVRGQIGPAGARRWVILRLRPIRDHHLARVVVTLIDITDGMQTQDQLRRATEEAQRLALVARATDNAVTITITDADADADAIIEWVNEPFATQTGYILQDVMGRRRTDVIDPVCRQSPKFEQFLARIALGHGADGEFPMMTRTGTRYWAAVEVRPVREQGRITHQLWIEHDITLHRDTQRRLHQAISEAEDLASALRQEKTLLSSVISAIPQLVYWKDHHGRYAGCNTAYLAFRGLEAGHDLPERDEAATSHLDAIGNALARLEAQVLASGRPVLDHTVEVADTHGQVRSLLLSVLPLPLDGPGGDASRAVIGVGADITLAREMERQLAQANRLESIGQLASGIAHEINTPIQFVTDNTQFLTETTAEMLTALTQLQDLLGHEPMTGDGCAADVSNGRAVLDRLDLAFLRDEVPGALRECREGLDRVAQIVRAMKDYAHPGLGRADIDVNRAIASTVQVCRNEWKYVAEVHLDLAPDAGLVPAYEGELKQVILNMIVNAAQAIADDRTRPSQAGLGQITVTTRQTPTDILIIIADDGPGMSPKVRDRVFDPFFTTKQVGKGTGQGLSLAHAVIVAKHRGTIDLVTAPGQGATFTLHLPLHPDDRDAPDAPDAPDTSDPSDDGPTDEAQP